MANLKDIIVNGTSRFIGKVFGPTPSEGDYSKQLATTEYVIDNSANQSISNLTEEGESKINASKCLLTNTIVTDPTAYNAVKSYSQDSFDLSKFTVVGSPTITDDGVASGFSISNYIQGNALSKITSNIIYEGKFTTGSDITTVQMLSTANTAFLFQLYINTDMRLYADFGDGSSWNIINNGRFGSLSPNTTYKFKIETTASQIKFYLDGALKNTLDVSNFTFDILNLIGIIGRRLYSTERPFRGSIDLKHFSIIVDGVEVFSGNKTGLDVIKPLDAEELGDVYVNEHGIVENFNVNNAIKAPMSFNPVSAVKIRSLLTWNTGSAQPKDGINVPYVFGPNKWRLEVTSTNVHATNDLDTSTNTAFNIAIPELQNGDAIEIIETITIGTRTVKVIINETDEYSGSTTFAATQAFSTSELAIGNAAFDGSSEYFWNGAINLNMFIVYIDGKLAYEPCLYIPYTQSKTGSKIVENVYRNRVYELYNQTGKAEYYTLDTENENITLPLGEIYGLIASKADTVNVANKSLEDLTDDGNALINNSKAWITGKLTDDKTTYDAIRKLSVSTFDRSKFEVVGSPIISEDGIASGFSGNYNTTTIKTAQSIDTTNANSMDIEYVFTLTSPLTGSTGQCFLLNYNNSAINGAPATQFYHDAFQGSMIPLTSLEVGGEYKVVYNLVSSGTSYGKLYKNGTLITSGSLDDFTAWKQNNPIFLYGYFSGENANKCNIDLKQFNVKVDGVEVFSGNRTELDVIKADNFEVVNTGRTIYAYVYNDGSVNHTIYANSATAPTTLYNEDGTAYTGTDFTVADNVVSYSGNTCAYTAASNITLYINITDDGVASGFGPGNYITTTNSINANNSITIKLGYYYNDNIGGSAYQFSGGNLASVRVFLGKSVSIWGSSQLMSSFTYNSTLLLQDGDFVLTETTFESNKITFKATANGISVTKTSNVSLTLSSPRMLIGKETSADNFFKGSIDLNAFKIYVDGNLVYQPCLKIPYTLSKTGSKIVDAAYYDRVIDVYEQYGAAYYYTLDRQNGLSSLPFGDIYGLMMKKDDSPDYFSADTPPEFPFIAWREGYINVTVPANEKLLINGNEVVSAGTSAVQMQLRVGLYDNITFSNTTGATLTFYPCKGVLYTI